MGHTLCPMRHVADADAVGGPPTPNPMRMTRRTMLGTLAGLPGGMTGVGLAQEPPRAAPAPLGPVWRWGFPPLTAITLSPEGERVLVITRDGMLHCYTHLGERIWRRRAPAVDHVAANYHATLTVLWSARRPGHSKVHFVDHTGHHFQDLNLSEPVRSVVISPNGAFVAVAAGRSVLHCVRTTGELRVRRIDLNAVPFRMQFGPADSLYIACEKPDRLLLVRGNGRLVWTREPTQVSNYSISASEDGTRVAVGTYGPGDTVTASLVDADNHTHWTLQRAGRNPRVRLSATGESVLLSYEEGLSHQGRTRFVRRLHFLPRGPVGSWSRGGLERQLLPLAVEQAGRWVVALDLPGQLELPRLRLYGGDGKSRYAYPCGAPVLMATASQDGRHFATYLQDGHVEVGRVIET